MNQERTPSPQPRNVRDLMIVLTTAAAAWGAVKLELSTLVKAETNVATIALRSDAAGEITQRIDSAAQALEHRMDARFDTLTQDFAAQLASLPEPETITRTILVPSGPDSAQSVALAEHIATLENGIRELAREGARQRTQYEEWRDWMKSNGFLRREKTKFNGDGH